MGAILHNMLLLPLISINHPFCQHMNSLNYSSSIDSGAAVKMLIILCLCWKKITGWLINLTILLPIRSFCFGQKYEYIKVAPSWVRWSFCCMKGNFFLAYKIIVQKWSFLEKWTVFKTWHLLNVLILCTWVPWMEDIYIDSMLLLLFTWELTFSIFR